MSSFISLLKKELQKTKDFKTLLFLGVILLVFLYFTSANNSTTPTSSIENITLSRCVDGDTAIFSLDGSEVKVRFLAIDAPEVGKDGNVSDPYGDEAAQYTCDALQRADSITFEYEEDKYDNYDRLLAWVFIDDSLLQEQLIQEGLVKVAYLYDDYKYTNVLEVAQDIAKSNQIGLWSNH
ncbi:MAG: thermonuclease family protein [Anaerorhabdus sp.]